jgi:hypothetical protein
MSFALVIEIGLLGRRQSSGIISTSSCLQL